MTRYTPTDTLIGLFTTLVLLLAYGWRWATKPEWR